jgi:serine/threonine protein kinase
MPLNADDRLGTTIENYRLLSVLGTGSTSVVYLGQRLDDPLGLVAVKILSYQAAGTLADDHAAFRQRFLREARAASKLRHENILPVLSFGDADDVTFMVMPVIVGGTLATRVADGRGPLSLQEIVTYLKQFASALDAAHAYGLVHRDIKPSNILLDEHGHLYLTDFGIARLFDNGENTLTADNLATLTRTGQVLGTPYYMAPEQIRGEPVGPATDIYATGVVLYQLVTGQVPFHGDTPLAVALQHLQESPTSPGLLRDELPEPIEGVIMRALAKDPSERFASAGELYEAFEGGLAELGSTEDLERTSSVWRFATSLSEHPSMPEVSALSSVEEDYAALYDQLVGAQLGGYHLDHLITCTERDAVFLARREGTAVPYRLRVLALPSELAEDELATYLNRFQEQVLALVDLQDPHILALYDFGSDEGIPYLVTSDVAGQSLAEALEPGTQCDLATIGAYLNQISEALGLAHQKGILHLGLTPDSIFVREGGDVVVADFGVSSLLHDPVFEADGTASSPSWHAWAPEQLLGEPVGEYTDVYALGAVLYQLLAGHPVFTGDTQNDVAEQHLHAAIPPLRTKRVGLPSGLENIVARSLAKEPGRRFRRPADLAAAYRRVMVRAAGDADAATSATTLTGAGLSGATIAATRASTSPPAVAATKTTSPIRAKVQPAPGQTVLADSTPARAVETPRLPPETDEITPEERLKLAVTGALQRVSPALRRRPWLAVVGIVALVAVLAVSSFVFIHSRSTARTTARTTGHPLVLTGCVAIAGLGDVAGMRFFDHLSGSGLTDAVSTCLKGLPMPADGYQYAAWLIDSMHEHVTPLGTFTQKNGGWFLDYPTSSAQGGANLLGLGDKVEITLEHGQVLAPTGQVVIAAQYPPDAFVHIKHLLVAFPNTPGQKGLLVGLMQQANVLLNQAQSLQDFAQRQLDVSEGCAAQNIINIIEGKSGPHYHPLDAACGVTYRDITPADDGYGLISSSGYLPGAADHAALAASAPDATAHIKKHSHDVVTAATNMTTWAQKLDQDALNVVQQQNFSTSNATDAATLAHNIVFGTDIDGDGSVDDVAGESGLFNAYTHGQLMAFLPFGSMTSMGNGM